MGLVVEDGDGRSTGGRPATRLCLNPSGGVVLAADLGAHHDRLAVADLSGNLLAEKSAQRPHPFDSLKADAHETRLSCQNPVR